MDRELAPEVIRRRVVRRVIVGIVALAIAVVSFAAGVDWLRPSLNRSAILTARVQRGVIEAMLQANGTVVPRTEQVVSSPVEARVLRIERRAGETVRVGDELLTLDTSATRLEAARLEERVTQKENLGAETRLRLDESIATLRAQIEQKQLDVEILNYAAEQKSRLRSAGLIAEQDARGATAASKKGAIELRQLEEALVRAIELRRVQLQAGQSDLAMARRELDESKRQLELAMLRAEREGVLTSIVSEIGATVRRGDIVARIADLSAYRVEATISDVHASRLSTGLRTRVKLDDVVTSGSIESVDPRIVNGVVKFYVTLDEPAHPRLRNNLRVDVQVVAGRRGDGVTVRRGALGRSEYAFVVRNDHLERVPVRFGVTGDETIEILHGLTEGDEVVISDMSDFEDIRKVKLR